MKQKSDTSIHLYGGQEKIEGWRKHAAGAVCGGVLVPIEKIFHRGETTGDKVSEKHPSFVSASK